MSLTAAALRRVAVAVQTTAAAGIAWALASFAAWPWTVALATGIAIVLAVFCASVALAFFVTLHGIGLPRRDRVALLPENIRPAPLGIAQALRCYASECIVVFRMFNWLQPFRSRLTVPRAADTHPGCDAPTVLLVHGYGCNHAVWLDMAPHLAAHGYRCETIDLEPVLGDIDDYAPPLLARMREIATRTGRSPLLVCHSMGGLAVRAWWRRHAGQHETQGAPQVLTLGTPHAGTFLAMFSPAHNARQMRWQGDWTQALPPLPRLTCVWTPCDQMVMPASTAVQPGSVAHRVDVVGHVGLVNDPRVWAIFQAVLASSFDSSFSTPRRI